MGAVVTSEGFSWKHYFQRIWLMTVLPMYGMVLGILFFLNRDADPQGKVLVAVFVFILVNAGSMGSYWICEERHLKLSSEYGVAYHEALDAKLRQKSFEALVHGQWLEMIVEMRKRKKA